MMLAVGLLQMSFVRLEKFLSISVCQALWVVIEFHNTLLTHLLEWSYGFLFYSTNIVSSINWFLNAETTLLSYYKHQLIVVMVPYPFYMLLNLICYYFVRIFYVCVREGYWFIVLNFWYCWLHKISWKVCLLPLLSKRLCVGLVLFLKCLTEFTSEMESGVFFVERFQVNNSSY